MDETTTTLEENQKFLLQKMDEIATATTLEEQVIKETVELKAQIAQRAKDAHMLNESADFLKLQGLKRVVDKKAAATYKTDADINKLATEVQTLQKQLDGLKAKKFPEVYAQQSALRELLKALRQFVLDKTPMEVSGVQIKTYADALKVYQKIKVAVVTIAATAQ